MGTIHKVLLADLALLATVPLDRFGEDIGAARLEHDLGIDSLALYELVTRLEHHLSIEIPDEDTGRFTTVGDIQAALDRLARTD